MIYEKLGDTGPINSSTGIRDNSLTYLFVFCWSGAGSIVCECANRAVRGSCSSSTRYCTTGTVVLLASSNYEN